jgi:putative ATP-dependent endonuclease of OLD family
MRIKKVKLNNFRNFKDETVHFGNNVVIVGGNDSGKTNLLYALRLLLDDTLPESKLTPSPYDFNFESESGKFTIKLYLCSINEECILAKLKDKVSEQGDTLIKFIGTYDKRSGKLDYGLYIGTSNSKLSKIESRYYLRAMNLRYVESTRDLESYIIKEKKWLLDKTKEERTPEECDTDDEQIRNINRCLDCISETVSNLNFVKQSTTLLNDNLQNLSSRNSDKQVSFNAAGTDARIMLDRLTLSAKQNNNVFKLSGDGFSNQTHLSLWAARNSIEKEDAEIVNKITIYCIEEIEAHLHPHHQRILAKFVNRYFADKQVIITTHSPQIASQFPPESIVALMNNGQTLSYGYKASAKKLEEMVQFGYRMNAISAEIYFAEVVFLVEGPSEVLFYTALSKSIGIDLDYYNVSIIDVGGIGFAAYCDIASSLGKGVVIRTDLDISKIPKKDQHGFAGAKRGYNITKRIFNIDIFERSKFKISDLTWDGGPADVSQESSDALMEARSKLEKYDIYISNVDLENDIIRDTTFGEHVLDYFETSDTDEAVKYLQAKKATNMYKLLMHKGDKLQSLANQKIAEPLYKAKSLSESA